ncbi:MAG: class I SAM-dependent DNA methyltransferase, partial [Chitinophagaceae bacterium]
MREYGNIQRQDAVLSYSARQPRLDAAGQPVTRWDGNSTKPHPVTGQEVPDETARIIVFDYLNPKPAEWPEADFIVGNPPFIGPARMREALGDGYTEALRKAYKNVVPESADFVMFWWHKAAELARTGFVERFGFITTNSIKQTFNRRVIEVQMDANPPLSLSLAIGNHPWVDSVDGAAVEIAMTVAEKGPTNGRLLKVTTQGKTDGLELEVSFSESVGKIHSDLTIGANIASVHTLKSNENISSRGVQLIGAGFIVNKEEAERIGLNRRSGIENFIKEYKNGKDLTSTTREVMAIDLYGLKIDEVKTLFPELYQWIYERVKPERDQNNRESYKKNWWIHGEARGNFRPALEGLNRYVATVETSKHRFFTFLEKAILPDNMLVAIAVEDAFHLGILSSRFHIYWALATGSDLGGNTPRYNKTRCFETFPFPAATEPQKANIRSLAEQLDAHRKKQQAQHPTLTITDMYNVLEKLRAGQPLSAKEQKTHEQGLISILL